MRKLVKVFAALADETRIRILKVLWERDCCVCEVMQSLGISQSRASRNLSILENAGFVRSSREGLWVVYSIDRDGNDYAMSLLQILNTCMGSEEMIELDKQRLKGATRVGCGALKK